MLQDAQIKVDLVNVLPEIATPIYNTILGAGLPNKFHSYNTTLNMVPGVAAENGQISTQFAKSYNDITTIFFTFGTHEFTPLNEAERVRNETNAVFWAVAQRPKRSRSWCRSAL